ncbi:unnamed protein product [Calypogeia fissa]
MAGLPVPRGGHYSSSSVLKKKMEQKPSKSYLLATVTGLLSSSCCVIQLILNTFSISCAGFSVLTPYRPLFLCLTIFVTIASAREYGLLTRRTLTTLLIASMLSASPEVVKIYNEGGVDALKWEWGNGNWNGKVGELMVFELEMTGLSCQACANRVKLGIEKAEGVVRCDIFLEEMRAVVRSRPGAFEDEAQLEELVKVAGSKYRGKVVKRYGLKVSGVGGVEEKVEL